MLAMAVILGLAATPMVVECPVSGVEEISVQAVLMLPPLSRDDQERLEVMSGALTRRTEDYVQRDLRAMTLFGGPVRASVMPDHLRIEFSVPPKSTRTAAALLESLLRRPSLRQEDLDAEIEARLGREFDRWWAPLMRRTEFVRRRPFPRAEAMRLWQSLLASDRLAVAVGGSVEPGVMAEEVGRRFVGLPLAKPTREPRPVTPTTFPARSVDLPVRLLALTALGGGKASTLFRVAREQMGVSYRQEAILWPVPDAFEVRLQVGSESSPPAELWTAVRESVSAWTEADRTRALGYLDAVLLRGLPYHGLYLSRAGPGLDRLEDRTFLSAYWPLKTGQPWDPERLRTQAAAVSLEDLRAMALTMLP